MYASCKSQPNRWNGLIMCDNIVEKETNEDRKNEKCIKEYFLWYNA